MNSHVSYDKVTKKTLIWYYSMCISTLYCEIVTYLTSIVSRNDVNRSAIKTLQF